MIRCVAGPTRLSHLACSYRILRSGPFALPRPERSKPLTGSAYHLERAHVCMRNGNYVGILCPNYSGIHCAILATPLRCFINVFWERSGFAVISQVFCDGDFRGMWRAEAAAAERQISEREDTNTHREGFLWSLSWLYEEEVLWGFSTFGRLSATITSVDPWHSSHHFKHHVWEPAHLSSIDSTLPKMAQWRPVRGHSIK